MSVISRLAHQWAARCFGFDHVTNIPLRALRILEEAAELAQAAAVPLDKAEACIASVYARPPGDLRQEIGGTLLTTVILCEALHAEADAILEAELSRVLAKSRDHFAARNQQKLDMGLDVPATESVPSVFGVKPGQASKQSFIPPTPKTLDDIDGSLR
jgi:hypothetical protein